MTTQSHAIINLALLSRQGKPYLHRYALIGAILPDLAMFIFFAVETFVRRTPQQELWSQRYFMPAWQNFFDIFNSIPFILLVLGLGYFLVKSEKITVLAWSMLIHCGFDFSYTTMMRIITFFRYPTSPSKVLSLIGMRRTTGTSSRRLKSWRHSQFRFICFGDCKRGQAGGFWWE